MSAVRIARVTLAAPRDSLEALAEFYCGRLELPRSADPTLTIGIGAATLAFVPEYGERQPFYHYAFLVPGDRFEAAHRWLRDRVQTLPIPVTGTDIIDFEFWNARACYFHDPVGNIVEFIAHRDLDRTPERTGDFSSDELVAISEVGLVTPDLQAAIDILSARLDLPAWLGDAAGPDSLCFLGRQAHTLILSAPGRGWLPTARPAESHPVDVILVGDMVGQVSLPDGQHVRIQRPDR